jgi:hypothetical protein
MSDEQDDLRLINKALKPDRYDLGQSLRDAGFRYVHDWWTDYSYDEKVEEGDGAWVKTVYNDSHDSFELVVSLETEDGFVDLCDIEGKQIRNATYGPMPKWKALKFAQSLEAKLASGELYSTRGHVDRLREAQNRYNPKGLRRDRSGQLVDKYGRPMSIDWESFKKRRGKQQNPLHNAAVYDPKKVVEALLDT